MRAPLLLLVVTYAIALIGFVLIPGVNEMGKSIHLTFFQAFYILSYTATTIGFGEIPYPFTNDQRIWMTFSIYLTVVAWFYAIGTIISLFQDPALKQAFTAASFKRSIEHLHEPFYIICGYGETGSELVRALDKNELRVVVVEINQERIHELGMTDYQFNIPNLCADAKNPEILLSAGLNNPMCQGVAALTDDDHANLAIAVAVKLIKPDLRMLARVENDVVAANMSSFGTDHIINPYKIFGEHLAMEVNSLGTYLLHEWLTSVPGDIVKTPSAVPKGNWIVCGYGRFGKAVVKSLKRENMKIRIIEADPVGTDCEECVVGSGVESHILKEAGIDDAVGIVAGTDNDINNLSIVMTALEMNPNLFVVIRKNRRINEPLFEHFNADITMQPSDIIAHACLSYMVSPMLAAFLNLSRLQSNSWANAVIARLVMAVGEQAPDTWGVRILPTHASAICELLAQGHTIKLHHLTMNPSNGEEHLAIVPIMLVRDDEKILLPDLNAEVKLGDRYLCCGLDTAKATQNFLLNDIRNMSYLVTGLELPETFIGRLLLMKKQS
ncbi:MAG: potassium transporter TrkA [Methylophilaceae bacterium 17-44-8]|nr:MAG: potassium transporter TrkA [Methylophilales bacterium 16-45-7]OZA05557.1 MAG: potassium transporter TrkA [Methylophilaceae bacterium 17-44-8]